MKIGIDARLYSQTGVGRYLRNIIEELSIIDYKNQYIVYLSVFDFDKFELPNKRWQKKLLKIKWHTFREQLEIPYILYKDNIDVAHFPYFNVPIFYSGKYLLTIHDLIVDHFDTGRASTLPKFFYKLKRSAYKYAVSQGIKRASRITVISETTKKEVIDHYNEVDQTKIFVTYDALDSRFLNLTKKQKFLRYFQFPYILYVGNAYPHKNIDRLLYSLKNLHKNFPINLVLAGDDQYFYPRSKQLAQSLNLSTKVVYFGNANDEQLINLYAGAKCLVFPSLMEGFGLPNFEAISCGCLPVVSDIDVFREIWNDKLEYFDPKNINDITIKISKVLSFTTKQYNDKVQSAQKVIEKYSWKKTAHKTLSLYEEIFK